MQQVWVSVGSNIEREQHVLAAIKGMSLLFGDLVLSPVYETVAEGFDGDPFLNLVVGFKTVLLPAELHSKLREIENKNGRTRTAEKFSSRTLDLDLLTYGDQIGNEGGKDLPRDEVLKYAFVLKPLADVAPDELHPEQKQSYSRLWERFKGNKKGLDVFDIDLQSAFTSSNSE